MQVENIDPEILNELAVRAGEMAGPGFLIRDWATGVKFSTVRQLVELA